MLQEPKAWASFTLALCAGCTLSFDASRLDSHECESPDPRTERTFHVAIDGSDDADGSEDAPFATLQRAADVAEPGDLVVARDGEYAGFEVARSGTADAPIVFRGEGAKIDRPTADGNGIRIVDAAHVWIEGFRIDPAEGRLTDAGIRQTADGGPVDGLVIRDNHVVGATRGIGLADAAGALVTGNEVRDHMEFGISVGNAGSDGATIRGNVVYDVGDAGIFADSEDAPGTDSLVTELTIEDNKVHHTNDAIALDSVHDSVVRNNLLYAFERDGIRIYSVAGAAAPSGLAVVNNTVHGPAGGIGAALRVMEHGDGNAAFNNVLVHDGDTGIIVWSADGLALGFNAVGGGFALEEAGPTVGLAEWRDAGFGEGSLVTTSGALFADAASLRYELREGAPAIDAGEASFEGRDAPGRDIAGNARPAGGGIDLGAFERGAEPACP